MFAISGRARFASIIALTSIQILWASASALAAQPVVTITPATKSIREPGFDVQLGTPSVLISRSGATSTSLTVNYTVSGTATSGTDYRALAGTITLDPGIGAAQLAIHVIEDNLTERDETLTIALAASSQYTLGSPKATTVTILDRDQKIRLTRIDTLASEPGQDNATVTIERLGSLSGDLTIPLTYTGTATLGSDFTAPSSVTLAAGDSITTLTIVPVSDGTAEGNETVTVGVTGFAAIGNSRVTIADAAATVAVNPANVIESQGNTANFVITRTGNLSQALTVPFTVSGTATNGTDYNTIGTSVVIPAGAASANVPIVVKSDATQEGGETVILTLGSGPKHGAGVPNSATLLIQDNVAPTVATLALAASSVIGGSPVSATVTLNGPAPAGGIPVTLTSSSTSATLQPTSLNIASGQSAATFTINTSPRSTDATATISAVAPTGAAQTQSLTIQAAVLTTASLNKTSVTAQAASDTTSVLGTVTLTGPAPSSGTAIQLSSSNPAAAGVPASIVIPANQSSATFKVTVVPLAATTTATITATRATISKTITLTVKTPTVTTIALNPSSLAGGVGNPRTTSGTFTIDGPAPAAGLTATFSDNSDRISETPATVFLPGGATSGPLTLAVLAVSTPTLATVTVSLPGGSQTANLTITPPVPQSITFDETTIVGGQVGHGHLTLDGSAPVDGFTVPIASNSAAATPCFNGTPITSISFQQGFGNRPFSLCTQVVAGTAVVTVTAGQGASALSKTIEVGVPATVAASSVVLTATDVVAGASLNGTVTLAQPAASPNGSPVTISSNNAAVKFRIGSTNFTQTLPLVVGAGQTSAGFQVSTSAVGQDTVVTVSASPGAASQGLMVRAPILTAVGVDPATVAGGVSTTGHVSLSGKAPPGGLPVQLTKSNSLITLPSIVTVAEGLQGATFTVTTSTTSVDTATVITATAGPNQRTTTLDITGPIAVSTLAVSPATVSAGNPTTLTITLNTPAPSGGSVVSLTCNSPNVTAPPTVTIAAGQTTTTVVVNTLVFGANQDVTTTLTATLGGVTKTRQLTIQPLSISALTFAPISPIGGVALTGTVQLNRAAPGTGITLALISSDPSITVPATVTIPAAQFSATFTATTQPVVSTTVVSVSATFDQAVRSVSVSVRPPDMSTLVVTPSLVLAGSNATGTATLNGAAPTGGALVGLSSNSSVVSVPATVTVPAGQTSVTFTAAVSIDAPTGTVTLGASRPGGGLVNRGLTVQSVGATSLTLSSTTVQGGTAVTGTVGLGAPIQIGFNFALSSNNPAATVPATLSLNVGISNPQFTISTTPVTTPTTVTITAGTGALAKTATLTITP